jgi:hypothetical protein
MALGDNYNSNGNRPQRREPQVFSKFRFYNSDSSIEPTSLSTTFWNHMLKISISPKKVGQDTGFDHDNSIDIYLTFGKAKILYDEICLFQADKNKYKNLGVATNSGLISISTGKELGKDNSPCIIIRKIDAEGNVTASTAYEFRKDFYSVRNFNEKSPESFEKAILDSIEIEYFKTLLLNYYEAMTGAHAYAVIDELKYEHSRVHTKLDVIAEKLGIKYVSRGDGGGRSHFDNAKGNGWTPPMSDTIEDDFPV